jgi:hypothetical protein
LLDTKNTSRSAGLKIRLKSTARNKPSILSRPKKTAIISEARAIRDIFSEVYQRLFLIQEVLRLNPAMGVSSETSIPERWRVNSHAQHLRFYDKIFGLGVMAERSKAVVLKTTVGKPTGGSNPSHSASNFIKP